MNLKYLILQLSLQGLKVLFEYKANLYILLFLSFEYYLKTVKKQNVLALTNFYKFQEIYLYKLLAF